LQVDPCCFTTARDVIDDYGRVAELITLHLLRKLGADLLLKVGGFIDITHNHPVPQFLGSLKPGHVFLQLIVWTWDYPSYEGWFLDVESGPAQIELTMNQSEINCIRNIPTHTAKRAPLDRGYCLSSINAKNASMFLIKMLMFNLLLLDNSVEAAETGQLSFPPTSIEDVVVASLVFWAAVGDFFRDAVGYPYNIVVSAAVPWLNTQTLYLVVFVALNVAIPLLLTAGIISCYRCIVDVLRSKFPAVKTISYEDDVVKTRVSVCTDENHTGGFPTVVHVKFPSTDVLNNRVNEMAIDGSGFFPSDRKEVVAIMLQKPDGTLTPHGMGFRVKDHIVTARHIAEPIVGSSYDVYLVPFSLKGRNYVLDAARAMQIDKKIFDEDENVILTTRVDAFATPLSKKIWSKLQVGESSVNRKSSYNINVSTVGFEKSCNMLVISNGKTSKADEQSLEISHTASTLKGYSGGPIYSGKSVVGVHVSTLGGKNIAVRIEIVTWFINKSLEGSRVDEESTDIVFDKIRQVIRYKGRAYDVDFFDEHVAAAIHNDSGEIFLRGFDEFEDDEIIGYQDDIEDLQYEARRDNTVEDVVDRIHSTYAQKYGLNLGKYRPRKGKKNANYNDEAYESDTSESCSKDPAIADQPAVEVPSRRGKKKKYQPRKNSDESNEAYQIIDTKKPQHQRPFDPANENVKKYVDEHIEELKTMGFKENTYQMPIMTPAAEDVSLMRHLELKHERYLKMKQPPTDNEMKRAVDIWIAKNPGCRFITDPDYDTTKNINKIINSTMIKDKKSPGYPFMDEGLMNNAQVLEHYGDSMADLVRASWNDPFVARWMPKCELTKEKKILAEMPRCVNGCGLAKTIKDMCIFRNFRDNLHENWKDTEIIYCFSKEDQSHIVHLNNLFKDCDIVRCDDKPNWEMSCQHWHHMATAECVIRAAVKHPSMSDEFFQKWQLDVRNSFKEASEATYRTSSGKIFKSAAPGANKSGIYMTIDMNSINQQLTDIIVAIRLGLKNEQIMKFIFAAGGDDTLSYVPPEHREQWDSKYKELCESLGVEVGEAEKHPGFNGVEYFSHYLRFNGRNWTYKPVRFTKHIMNLIYTEDSSLRQALCSHMINHCWSERGEFEFFYNAYLHFHRLNPMDFPLKYLKDKFELQHNVAGLE